MWAEDRQWSKLSYRMEFAEGDFFKPGAGAAPRSHLFVC